MAKDPVEMNQEDYRGAAEGREGHALDSSRGDVGVFYTSGRWLVKPGHEEEFAQAFADSGVKDIDPPIRGLLQRPRLLQDLGQPRSYLSYAVWESREAIDEFRSRPDFPAMIARMREHLDDMQISTLKLVLGAGLADSGPRHDDHGQ